MSRVWTGRGLGGMMATMTIDRLLAPINGQPGPLVLTGADAWLQGRTLYGGASALIALIAAQRAFPGLPPLRAGQIAFIAPVGEAIAIESEIVRQGRNVTQVHSTICCEGKPALSALWVFAAAREANAVRSPDPVPDWPGDPLACAPLDTGGAPHFIKGNFELRHGQPQGIDRGAVIRRWARLIEPHSLDPAALLVLMGDVMPPGAIRIAQRPGPLSSVNWSFNVLDPVAPSPGGWYLAENASEHADAGYSSERLRLWDATGRQVLSGLQSVAVFG